MPRADNHDEHARLHVKTYAEGLRVIQYSEPWWPVKLWMWLLGQPWRHPTQEEINAAIRAHIADHVRLMGEDTDAPR